MSSGCKKKASRSRSTTSAGQLLKSDSTFLVDALAVGLNHLPDEVVLDLQPPFPILDDAKSADGQPILATCGPTPAVPDGPSNYLFVPKGNGNFTKRGIRPGDIVRYFVKVDEDSQEHGIEQVGYIELIVRRVDVNSPQNGIIFEGGLDGRVDFPRRIEIWRFSDKRMLDILKRNNRYINKPKTLISWEPSPDETALTQILEQANQWLRNVADGQTTWEPEPLMSKLPAKLRASPLLVNLISENAMQSGPFDPTESRQLQQAIWLRDISVWAKGEAVSPVDIAQALFDWTLRNIQLDGSMLEGNVYQPWQVLMYGHGTAEQRAWVFAELCRQQQLDVVMLATGKKGWLPALLHGGQLYLFDTQLGMPLPGAEPESVATLSAVRGDPSLLRALDITTPDTNEELQYPITAENLESITAEIVATPLQVSKRAWLLEQALSGENFVVLAANTSRIAEELKKQAQVDDVQMWPLPFDSILAEQDLSIEQRKHAAWRFLVFATRPHLWKARTLHFQGTKPIPLEERNDPLAQPDLGHQKTTALYQDPRIRPSETVLQKIPPTKRALYSAAKGNASYWLGLLSYDLGKYRVAKDWFAQRTLAAKPDGPWTSGARYNLARTLEALGDTDGAIQLLESDKSPQRHGNLLRARRLGAEKLTKKRAEKRN